MTRWQIAGVALWISVLASLGYIYHQAYSPTAMAAAKALRAQKDRVVGQTLAQLVCADNIEGRDDGKTSAEAVARAIIAKCGPLMPATEPPTGCGDTKCMQMMQQTSLIMESLIVIDARDDGAAFAKERAEDAKAASVWAQTH